MSGINTKLFIENFLKIKSKTGEIIPLKLNKPQLKLYNALGKQYEDGKPLRAIILKARQMGFSTLTEAMIFKRTAMAKNIKSGIIAHISDASENLFKMSKLFYDMLPDRFYFTDGANALKPAVRASNAYELVFDTKNGKGLKSGIRCMTAGGEGIGRSDTFQNLHVSEYAWWPGDKASILLGAVQAVPNVPNSMIIIESTANGYDDFKNRWDMAVEGKSDYVPVFCAWWEMDEYRLPYSGFILSDEEKRIKELYSLDNDQLTWRRWCIANNCGGDLEKFKQEYPACPEEAFLASGSCVFDQEKVLERIQRSPEPVAIGRFDFKYDELHITDIRWADDKNGFIKIYKKPVKGVPYVIGGDTAGEGSDNFVGQVLDNTTGEQVAVLKHQFDPHIYTRLMFCLGKYYNDALIGIEANFTTYPIEELQRLRYPRQYVRESTDTYTHAPKRSFGFQTTSKSRPAAVDELIKIVAEETDTINDKETLREMLTFVKNERGRAEAIKGEHDDMVMALAIAHYISDQQKKKAESTTERRKTKWHQSQKEDYRNARKKEDRDRMRDLWGEPC